MPQLLVRVTGPRRGQVLNLLPDDHNFSAAEEGPDYAIFQFEAGAESVFRGYDAPVDTEAGGYAGRIDVDAIPARLLARKKIRVQSATGAPGGGFDVSWSDVDQHFRHLAKSPAQTERDRGTTLPRLTRG